jgi:phage nucleotide-binding protein
MMVYGEPGAGKTYFGGTAAGHPELSPILLVDVEGGALTLRGKNVDVIQARTMKQVQEIQNALVKQTEPYYKTVFIDSGTELQKLDMRTVMLEQYNRRPDTTDIYVPSQREWGKSGERMRMIVRSFRDLPCNVIISALLAQDKDERTGTTSYFPSFPGKLRSEMPGFFDIVGLLRAVSEGGEIVRTLQVAKTDRVIAKDRTDSLENLITNPSLPDVWEAIHSNS